MGKEQGRMSNPTCRNADGTDDFTSALFTATLRVGNNATTGTTEYTLGSASGNYRWGEDANGYLYAANVPVQLTLAAGGSSSTATWQISTATQLSSTGANYSYITKVGIRAEVTDSGANGNLHMEWTSLTVTFYDANDIASVFDGSAVNPTCLPLVDSATTANDTRIVLPGDNSQVRLDVSGTVTLRSQDANHKKPPSLASTQIQGKVYIWTA
jgi:hypothetical protein